jgi:hypothetical protein
MSKHLVIPDIQAKPGVPLNQCEWIGKYIVEKKPDVIINLGDHADCESLSSYDRGKLDFEGRRFEQDIAASDMANDLLLGPLYEDDWYHECETHILYGNHEHRIERFVQDNPEMSGFMSKESLQYASYYDHVHDFLVPVAIDGVTYSHYFYNPANGRPYAGMIHTKLKNVGFSFTQGHKQGIDYGMRVLNNGHRHHGLVVGSCYLHREKYLGPQGHDHWNGVVMKYGVKDGDYDIKIVSLDALCQRYEGMTLAEFYRKPDIHIGV